MKKYKKIPNIFRIDTGNTHGWQFRGTVDGENLTQLFSDSKYGGVEEARKKCVEYKNEVFSAFEDEILNGWLIGNIGEKATSRSSCGIRGVCKTYSTKKDKRHYHWQCNYKDSEGRTKYKGFSINKYGEKQAFLLTVKYRRDEIKKFLPIASGKTKTKIENLIKEYDEIIEFVQFLPIENEAELFEFFENSTLSDTEKREELKRRIGQDLFRKRVMDYWGGKCAVTGVSVMVNAGHIKPWRDSNGDERLDVFNGIALSPDFDKAFDTGLITFKIDGSIKIAKQFNDDANLLGISENSRIEKIDANHVKYLKYHNAHIFMDNA